MPTPVGPVPPDPNDPELWEEWDGDPWADEGGHGASVWPRGMRMVAAVLLVGFVIFMVIR